MVKNNFTYKPKKAPTWTAQRVFSFDAGKGRAMSSTRAKRVIEGEFRASHPAFTAKPKINLNTIKSDRCHRTSSADIKNVLETYMAGRVTFHVLEKCVESIIDNDPADRDSWNDLKNDVRQAKKNAARVFTSKQKCEVYARSSLATIQALYKMLFLSLIHISEPTRQDTRSRMPSYA